MANAVLVPLVGTVGGLIASAMNVYNTVFNHESDDDDDDAVEFMEYAIISRITKLIGRDRRIPSRIQLFAEVTIANCTDAEFQSHFRVTRPSFELLLTFITPHLESNSVMGRPCIAARKQLLAVLWLLATPDSYRSVACRFNMGKSSLFHCFVRVITALNALGPQCIVWPQGAIREETKQCFYEMGGLRGIVGAIDGTYIPIKAPQVNPQSYINRKCFYAITLQAICDSNRKFIDCYAGWPSSVSDIRIFRNSTIYRAIVHNRHEYCEPTEYIIGDKAYPLTPWCLPPYIDRGNLQEFQLLFNRRHAQTRQIIERTFALLFGRFRRLRLLDMNRDDLLPATVIACCVMHNICLSNVDDMIQLYEAEGMPFVQGNDGEEIMQYHMQQPQQQMEARMFRDRLARNLRN